MLPCRPHHGVLMTEAPDPERGQDKRSPDVDIAAREDSTRFAVADTTLEGGVLLPETTALLQRWSRGEISDDELVAQTLADIVARGGETSEIPLEYRWNADEDHVSDERRGAGP